MTNLSESDIALTKGLELYQTKWMNSLPAEEDLKGMSFSPAFEKKMRKLIKAYDHPHMLTGSKRRITTIILVAIISCLIAGTVYAAREQIIEIFTKVYEKFTAVYYVTENENVSYLDEIEKIIEIGYIPEGYELYGEPDNFGYAYTCTYRNEENKELMFDQAVLTENGHHNVDTEGGDPPTDIYIGDIKGIYFKNGKGYHCVIWNTQKYYICVWGNGVSKEELIKIAESVIVE